MCPGTGLAIALCLRVEPVFVRCSREFLAVGTQDVQDHLLYFLVELRIMELGDRRFWAGSLSLFETTQDAQRGVAQYLDLSVDLSQLLPNDRIFNRSRSVNTQDLHDLERRSYDCSRRETRLNALPPRS